MRRSMKFYEMLKLSELCHQLFADGKTFSTWQLVALHCSEVLGRPVSVSSLVIVRASSSLDLNKLVTRKPREARKAVDEDSRLQDLERRVAWLEKLVDERTQPVSCRSQLCAEGARQ